MKKCRQCAKPATVHITEILDGQVQEIHLCESCAHDYLQPADENDSVDNAETVALKLKEVANEEDLLELDHIVCPNCGITFREFRSQGRLGCPHDYVVFQQELTSLLENIHGELQHCGKFPKQAPDSSQRQYELIKLRNQLRQAVEQENYETAAQLRDEIQTLEIEQAETGSGKED